MPKISAQMSGAEYTPCTGSDWSGRAANPFSTDAVTAGLTLPWNSGVVEGHINRIKMLKRKMYGRASPDLLRRRILLGN